jgi:hypothetical protein
VPREYREGSVERIAGEIRQETPMSRIAFASFIGTAIEFYDFYIYGLAAALVFPALFFPELSPTSGLLASFATYGVAFWRGLWAAPSSGTSEIGLGAR